VSDTRVWFGPPFEEDDIEGDIAEDIVLQLADACSQIENLLHKYASDAQVAGESPCQDIVPQLSDACGQIKDLLGQLKWLVYRPSKVEPTVPSLVEWKDDEDDPCPF